MGVPLQRWFRRVFYRRELVLALGVPFFINVEGHVVFVPSYGGRVALGAVRFWSVGDVFFEGVLRVVWVVRLDPMGVR